MDLARHRRKLLALSALLAVAGAAAAPGVPLSTDVTEVLPSSSKEVSQWLELSRRFDVFGVLMVGLDERPLPLPSPSLRSGEGRTALQESGFTPEGIAALRSVTSRLESLKAEGVLWSRSLANVDSIVEDEDGALVNELLMAPGLDTATLEKRVRADPQVKGALVSLDLMAYQVLVRVDPRRDATEVARVIREAVEATRGPLQAHYFGVPFFSAALTREVYAKLPWLVPAFVLLLVGVLARLLRGEGRLRRVAVVIAALAVALTFWMGLLRLFGIGLSQTSLGAALAVVVVGASAFPRAGGGPRMQVRLAVALGACALGSLLLADRKSTRLNSSHTSVSRMPSSA